MIGLVFNKPLNNKNLWKMLGVKNILQMMFQKVFFSFTKRKCTLHVWQKANVLLSNQPFR